MLHHLLPPGHYLGKRSSETDTHYLSRQHTPPQDLSRHPDRTAGPVAGDLKHGRRFLRDFTPALCLAPCHATGPGLTEERGNNGKRPSRGGRRVPEPAPPPRLERDPRRAGGSGKSRTRAPPPAHLGGKTRNTRAKVAPRPHWGTGRQGQPPLSAAALPRVFRRFHCPAAGGTLPRRAEPCCPPEARAGKDRGEGASCPRRSLPRSAPPPAAPRPRRSNSWSSTKAAVGLNGPD